MQEINVKHNLWSTLEALSRSGMSGTNNTHISITASLTLHLHLTNSYIIYLYKAARGHTNIEMILVSRHWNPLNHIFELKLST
jgi:hypothetical protein